MFRVAVILSCFNRKDKTLRCLKSLLKYIANCSISVYLVDDGSTDGTYETISKEFPEVNLIKGNGNLFWNRGMHLAWSTAINGDYDYYLWLNDDIILYPTFYDELMECEKIGNNKCIISGLIENIEKKGEILYGGSNKDKKLIQPNKLPQDITFMNGNVVLVPKSVVDKIGILDPKFHHDLGDVDYGLRAVENGFKVLSTRIPVAAGYTNGMCRVRKWNSNLIGRFKKLYSPLGSNPNINFYFRKKHYGLFNAVMYYFYLHFINILPDWCVELIWKDKYKNK